MGIEVGKSVAVCGFDGIQTTELTMPELTTIAQPIYEMGAIITRLLIKKIEGRLEEEEVYKLDVKLIARDSTLAFESKF
ncbi:HTH-type transcriptional repressor CytR [compost metagenome]